MQEEGECAEPTAKTEKLEKRDPAERLVKLDRPDRRVFQDQSVNLDYMASLELREVRGNEEHRESVVRLAKQDIEEGEDVLEEKDRKAHMVPRVSRVLLDRMERMDNRGWMEGQVLPDIQACAVPRGKMANPGLMEGLGQKERWVCRAIEAPMACLEFQELRDHPGCAGNKGGKELKE